MSEGSDGGVEGELRPVDQGYGNWYVGNKWVALVCGWKDLTHGFEEVVEEEFGILEIP